MEAFQEFAKPEERKVWLKCVVGLWCFQKPLKLFIDEQARIFHEELRNICGRDRCVKRCNLNNWKPRPNQSPPLECEVCSAWRDVIRNNHTSPHGKVYWKNSEPHLWSEDKWEVAKVYMTDGHKNHKSIDDFDISALLSLVNQCKHFKRFEIGDLCEKVAYVRNQIMHSANYQLTQEDLHSYLNRIKALGEVLAKHDPQFKSLPEDIDKIKDLHFSLVLPDNMAEVVQADVPADDQAEIQAQLGKQLEDTYFAFAQEAVEHRCTMMELSEIRLDPAQESADHARTRMLEVEIEVEPVEQEESGLSDAAQESADHARTRMLEVEQKESVLSVHLLKAQHTFNTLQENVRKFLPRRLLICSAAVTLTLLVAFVLLKVM